MTKIRKFLRSSSEAISELGFWPYLIAAVPANYGYYLIWNHLYNLALLRVA